MSDSFTIRSVFRDYTVEFTDDYYGTLSDILQEGDFFVVDQNIAELHPRLIETAGDAHRIVAPEEESKSYQGVIPFISHLIDAGFRKNHRLVVFGGGVTQDVAAFVASILYRGVDWVFFPTNMLTQCDSCIGSKTSINFRGYKNQLGGFYPPAQVFIDTSFLTTLGVREIASGMGEMLHYFLVTSEQDLAFFLEHGPQLKESGAGVQPFIRRSLQIKKAMIEIDEFDRGPRNVFNYGHSFGHALESVTNYAMPHGVAVAYGIDLANLVSAHLDFLPMAERNRLRNAAELVYAGFPLPPIDIDRYVAALRKDKKNQGNRLGLILTRGVGDMFRHVCDFDERVASVINEFFEEQLYLRET